MTNFERIKAMTVEEMAKELLVRTVCSCCIHFPAKEKPCKYDCTEGRKQWLNSEAQSLCNGLESEAQEE